LAKCPFYVKRVPRLDLNVERDIKNILALTSTYTSVAPPLLQVGSDKAFGCITSVFSML
jgi:hypothetical protein